MKTKHLFLTAILLVFSVLVVAEPVDPMRALEVAEQFAPQPAKAKRIKSKTAPEQSYEIVYTHHMPNSDRAAFYVVKLGEKGFVIISADDVANPILGYSYTNSWPTSISAQGDTLLPPQVLSYLNDMALQIETAIKKYPNLDSSDEWNNVGQKTVRKTSARKSADALPDSVGPLLTTTWGQGQYYNALCPEDAGGEDGHVPTGCVATAMAQIINYWGQKEEIKTRGIHSYDSQYGNLTVNYDSTSYDFANMPDALTAESTPEQLNAVAKLMYECGVSVNMQYGARESGAQNADARAALINFYRFNPDLSIAEKAYFSSADWDNLLRNNIANNQPVYYTGKNLAYGGHAFVCDGYNTTGYYHFNFGWTGLADGWYMLNAIAPTGIDFSSTQMVLVGIKPDNTGNVILGQTIGTSTFTVDEPLEFYHLLGHNTYLGKHGMNSCNNIVLFQSVDNFTPLVLDIFSHEEQNATIYDGNGGETLKSLYADKENDLSPIVSIGNALRVEYSGKMYYLGFHFAISKDNGCRRVSNILTSIDTTTVHLTWQENGTATQWQIEYGESGFSIGNGKIINTSQNHVDITVPDKFREYDFYIRPICDMNTFGPWSRVVSVTSLALYWTDIVKERPEGYLEDEYGNVFISSAEGLAWLSKVSNGLTETGGYDQFREKTITLLSDIDMGAHRWLPLGCSYIGFCGVFDGNGHIISNIYVNEPNEERVGFIACTGPACIKNVVLKNIYISGGYIYAGGLIGKCNESTEILNCFIQGEIRGKEFAGGLIGNGWATDIINCASVCNVYGGSIMGGIAASMTYSKVRNCYSAGNLFSSSIDKYAGAILGYITDCTIRNCYGLYNFSDITKLVDGCFQSTIEDNSFFVNVKDSYFNTRDSILTLLEPIQFEEAFSIELLDALNKGVVSLNRGDIMLWRSDSLYENGGFPYFEKKYYNVTCTNVSNVITRNIIKDTEIGVEISWTENGVADNWQIRYGLPINTNSQVLDSIIIKNATNNLDTLWGLSVGRTYVIDVRPMCDSTHKGGWSERISHMVDKPYWTDIVTQQPSGYVIDSKNDIHISSAEGLAWLSCVVNGLHGIEADNLEGRTIYLENDIDLGTGKWKAITPFSGNFDGKNNTISGLHIDELNDYQGMFGIVSNGNIENTILDNVYVRGQEGVGALCGYGSGVTVKKCSVAGTCVGIRNIGGLLGEVEHSTIDKCHTICDLTATQDGVGGIIGRVNGNTIVTNCSVKGHLQSNLTTVGGLVGGCDAIFGDVSIENSFVNVDVVVKYGAAGGLAGSARGFSGYDVKFVNCYFNGTISASQLYKYLTGALIGSTSGQVSINRCFANRLENRALLGLHEGDASELKKVDIDVYVKNDTACIMGNATTHYGLRLDDVLNEWVSEMSDSTYLTWTRDSLIETRGLPIFDKAFVEQYLAPNIYIDSLWETGALLKWNKTNAEIWEIKYIEHNFTSRTSITKIIYDTVASLSLTTGKVYDIYVRAIGEYGCSRWSNVLSIKPDKKNWKDIVISKPSDYKEDAFGNVYITSAEGMAWLMSCCNGFNGEQETAMTGKIIHIENDIDLSQYKWSPILQFDGIILGNGNTISGLYINADDENSLAPTAMFQFCTGSIYNVNLKKCFVKGYNASILCNNFLGKLINCGFQGEVQNSLGGNIASAIIIYNSGVIYNCYANVDVQGYVEPTGFIFENNGTIINCYSSGRVTFRYGTKCAQFSLRENNPDNQNYNYWLLDTYNEEHNILGSGYVSSPVGYTSFSRNSTSLILNNPVNIAGDNPTNLIDALNAWVDANISKGQYLHWVADTANVNDGYPILKQESIELPKYIITFSNDDGTILQQDTLELGSMPGYRGEIPTKDSTEKYNYTFSGWNKVLLPVTKDVTYTAQYEENINQYEVIFYNWNGELLQSSMVNYGEWPTYYNSEPWREADAQYTYTFVGWGDVSQVTGHASYYAQYEATINQYEINFYDWDGTLLQSSMVNYGKYPTYTGETPLRASTAQCTYTFSNWSPELTIVTSNAIYTAQYSEREEYYETACDEFYWDHNGETYYESGDYKYYTTTDQGCERVEVLHLTINRTQYAEETVTACDSYAWNGEIYTASGEYTYNTTTDQGCERVEVLHLTILPEATTESEELALCPSELPYDWYGQWLTEAGTYSATEQYAGMECDSVIHELTLNVYVQTLPAAVTLPIVRTGEAIDVTIPTAEIQAHMAAETWYAPNALVAWYVMNNSNWTALTDEPVATGITEVILKYAVETDCGNIESDKMVIVVETTDVENTQSQSPSSNCQKILYEDHIYILREGKVYSVMGHEM